MSDHSSCSLKLVNQAIDKCAFVDAHCESNSPFNFIHLYYCDFNQNLLFIPFGCYIIISIAIIKIFSINKLLQFFNSFYGVTLLALGNGAADVFSSMSAGGSDTTSIGFYLAASSCLGSGMFVSTIISSAITLMTKQPIKVTPYFFIRDVLFYMFVMCTIAYAIIFRQKIDMAFSCCFLAIYAIYVIFVFTQSKIIENMQKKAIRENTYIELKDHSMPCNNLLTQQNNIEIKFNDELLDYVSKSDKEIQEEGVIAGFYNFDKIHNNHHQHPNQYDESNNHNHGSHQVVIRDTYFHEIFKEHDPKSNRQSQINASNLEGDQSYMFNRMKSYVKKKYYDEVHNSDDQQKFNIKKLAHYLIAKPFNIWRDLMIPISEEDQWNRTFASLAPPIGFLTYMLYTKYFDYTDAIQIVAFIVCCLIGLFIRLRTYRNKAPRRGIMLLLLFSFAMSIFWIWATAQVLIDLLQIFGLLTGLPPNLLALTVLAWGNSIGDFIANTSIAKKGFAEMALTGCFAAPLFNNVLGLGITTLKTNYITGGEIALHWGEDHAQIPLIMIGGNLLTLAVILIFTILNRSYLSKIQAIINIIIYGAVLIWIVTKAI